MARRLAWIARGCSRLVRAQIALAALHFPGSHGPPLHHLRRNPRSHRVLSSRFLDRVEMEPARFCGSLRLVDLRRLRFRRFGCSRSTIAHRAFDTGGKNLRARRRDYFVALELDLPALAPARFVLTAALRFKASSSDFDKTRHCPRGKSPRRRFPIRTRASRFTS